MVHIPKPVVTMPANVQEMFDQLLAENPDVCLNDIRRLVPSFCSHSDESLGNHLMLARQRVAAQEVQKGDCRAATVYAVAVRLLACAHRDRRTIDPLQMQKLAYLAEGWALALRGQSLFCEPIEAWDHGPVVPELHQALRRFGAGPIHRELFATGVSMDSTGAVALPGAEEIAIVDGIWDAYGAMSQPQLIGLIDEENAPWDAARRQAISEKPSYISRDAIGKWILAKHDTADRGLDSSKSPYEAMKAAARSSIVVTEASVAMHGAERSRAVCDAEASSGSRAVDVRSLRRARKDRGGGRLLKQALTLAGLALVSAAGFILSE